MIPDNHVDDWQVIQVATGSSVSLMPSTTWKKANETTRAWLGPQWKWRWVGWLPKRVKQWRIDTFSNAEPAAFRLLRICFRCPGDLITENNLIRKTQWMSRCERNEAIAQLVSEGRIHETLVVVDTRAVVAYVCGSEGDSNGLS